MRLQFDFEEASKRGLLAINLSTNEIVRIQDESDLRQNHLHEISGEEKLTVESDAYVESVRK